MKQIIFIKKRNSRIANSVRPTGFTLIELLVVIGIIALLAAMIVGSAGYATSKARRASVETQREQLISIIESYKKNKGFYPPDNPNTPNPYAASYAFQNTLFYELTGCVIQGDPAANPFVFKSTVTQELLTNVNLMPSFNVSGILNSSADPTAVVNFFTGLKSYQHSMITVNGATFTVLGVSVPGPVQLTPVIGSIINPWRYVVSNPTNNPGSYDLWMDVYLGSKTNRICNWSRDPIVL